ncbi:MarR family transcriptional regulator [Actinomadura sp. NPDC000600]|uniref:MarR family winged helix-turn-helix transcriptional regulator n=1 Tax=Actinomadura sp. NPDC000600 TaxID=3154262 RepID=UPI003393D8E8
MSRPAGSAAVDRPRTPAAPAPTAPVATGGRIPPREAGTAGAVVSAAPAGDAARLAADMRAAAGRLIRRVRHESGTTLTWSQSVLLSGLAERGHATASELAAENGLRAQTVWSSLGTLEGRGLVARRRDPADRRNVHVSLTLDGRRELEADRRVREDWIRGVLEREFTAAQREVLARAVPLLVRLADSGDRETPGGD